MCDTLSVTRMLQKSHLKQGPSKVSMLYNSLCDSLVTAYHDRGLELVIELRLPPAEGVHGEGEVDLDCVREHDAIRELAVREC